MKRMDSVADSTLLGRYRVLDLASDKGLLCGKILGDMGADVVKVEPPGGDPARNIGPFIGDAPHPDGSLSWLALNTSKRGITLNLESADGRAVFLRLLRSADIVVESFVPGYLDALGIGYRNLAGVKPDIVMISISPYGQAGPYRYYKASDIVAWGMGGAMALTGDPDRPPFRISHHPQSYLHAGADAATGSLVALYNRNRTGMGEHVDVSIQASVAYCAENGIAAWDLDGVLRKRGEDARGGNHRATRIWRCKDGYVSWAHGGNSRLTPSMPLINWMHEEGFRDEYLDGFDWERANFNETTQEEMDRIEAPTARFFMMHTKAELLEGAVRHQAMLYPVATTADMLDNVQLKARHFWDVLNRGGAAGEIVYPAPCVRASGAVSGLSRPAPSIGEHNIEVYEGELGISRRQLLMLKQAGVV
jgi:benzylsuccinate CoA-transferase BbsE subunit